MTTPDAQHVTKLLGRIGDGDESAADELLPAVYAELRELAGAVFASQRNGHTLQPTALVHEAWLKMVGSLGRLDDRHHFFVVASRAMRQVLADHARGELRQKRGGGRAQITLDSSHELSAGPTVDLVAFEDSLRRLSELNERHGRVVELRLLGALTIPETAEVLGVSTATVRSDWSMAKAWLRTELSGA